MEVGPDNVMRITEFMHPRIEEVCGTMPAGLGAFILKRQRLVRALNRVVNKGRHVRTDTIRWFLALYALAGMRRFRRRTLRHRIETAHIDEWLTLAKDTVGRDYALGVEVLARIRSTGPLRPATVSVENGTVVVDLAEGEEGVSPGQACVFYAATGGGERLLGGGWIKSADGAWMAKSDYAAPAQATPAEAFLAGSR